MSNAAKDRSTRDQLSTLHDGLVVELDKRLGRPFPLERATADRSGEPRIGAEGRAAYAQRQAAQADSGIDDTLKWIERASSVVATMQETIKAYEETIYELRQRAADVERDRDEAYRQLGAAEKLMRSEVERATRNERALQTLDGRNKQLEHDYALLKTNVDGLLRLVHPNAE